MWPRARARGRCGAWPAPDARASCDSDGVAFLIAILTLALVGLVVLVVGAPLRRARRSGAARSLTGAPAQPHDATAASPAHTLDELEAAREAKYREIRDAELDFRTGKLSREDYQAIDAELRAEAIAILDSLQALTAGAQREPPGAPDA